MECCQCRIPGMLLQELWQIQFLSMKVCALENTDAQLHSLPVNGNYYIFMQVRPLVFKGGKDIGKEMLVFNVVFKKQYLVFLPFTVTVSLSILAILSLSFLPSKHAYALAGMRIYHCGPVNCMSHMFPVLIL